MRFDKNLYLKWLRPNNALMEGKSYSLVNQVVLVAKNKQEKIVGLTVLEPRDFSEAFLQRLRSREQSEELSSCTFFFYLPLFLKHRADTLNIKWQQILTPFVHIQFLPGRISIRDKIHLLNVDDSPVLLKFLKHAVQDLSFIEVVAQISDPLQAINEIKKRQPDIITMDIQMPKKTGVDLVKELLATTYYPILMISSLALEEGSLVFEALNAGAFDYIQKPRSEEKAAFNEELEEKILLAVAGSDVRKKIENIIPKHALSKKVTKSRAGSDYAKNLIWCLGASTGGTQALTRVFTSLPDEIPPTLVVQHIPPVFSKSFATSLNQLCPFTVKEAEDGELIKHNHVYIAPGGLQMGVAQKPEGLCIAIRDAPRVNRFKPSVDYLFSDIAKVDNLHLVAGLLTGMGKDGAQGLLKLKDKGHYTLAQDEATSAVFGMPRAAIEIHATQNVVPLDLIAQILMEQSTKFRNTG